MKPQSFAVDTNFLLDLVAPHDDARDALDVIRRRLPKAGIIATDSVLDEINHFASKPGSTVQAAVRKAMFHMSGHGIRPVCLSDLQAALADSIAGKILTHGIVPRT
ncbi:MAG: hypothetical protein LBM04_05965, partial [Opitutaceae bacterium]|nr:hypothetical protein [Opitutaceae bacterium]